MNKPAHILLVEDHTSVWKEYTEIFQKEIDSQVLTLDFAATAKEGLEKVNTNKTDLVIIDLILPDTPSQNELYFIDSLEEKIKLQNKKENLKGILVSAHKSLNTLKKIASSHNNWIVEALVKPIKRKSIRNAIENTLNFSLTSNSDAQNLYEINEDLAKEIEEEAQIIKMKLKRTVEDLLDIGKRLIDIREKIPYGYFKIWCKNELGFHYATALNLIRIADVFGNNDKIIDLNITPSILYYLASPSTPKKAREKVIGLIEDGEKISIVDSKKIVRDYKKNENLKSAPTIADPGVSIIKNNEKSRERPVNTLVSSQDKPEKQLVLPKQQILKVIPQNTQSSIPEVQSEINSPNNHWQQLGEHWLFNGYPDSESFRQHLPKSISLTIAFPSNPEWSKEKIIPSQSKSQSIHFSPFKDLDIFPVLTIFRNIIELHTMENDNLVFSFLPYPELILITESLGCKCIIAEPDINQFQRILSFWQEQQSKKQQ